MQLLGKGRTYGMALSGAGVPRRARGGPQRPVALRRVSWCSQRRWLRLARPRRARRASQNLAEVRGTSQRSAGPRRGPWDLAEVRRRLNFLVVGPSQESARPRRGPRDLAEARRT